jgi:uncharacterized protein
MTDVTLRSWRVLLLPGWLDSLPAHWQTRWQSLHGFEKVEQDDWQWPRRGDWMARLDDVLLAGERPALLVAHSLGCHLVGSWAAHSRHTARVSGALVVAPPDTERDDMPPQLFNWRPDTRSRLPFASIAVISADDPFSDAARGRAMATAWGSEIVDIGPRGHINGDSGLGDWPAGLALLRRLAVHAKR